MTTQRTDITAAPSAVEAQPVDERPTVAPSVDVYENDDELLVVADVPGVTRGDVHLEVEQGQLVLRATRRLATHGSVLGSELRDVDYARTFRLPRGLDVSKVSADLELGVLTIHLPKAEERKPRQIPIG